MTSLTLAGGSIFDGTGAPIRAADVVIDGEQIVSVGSDVEQGERVDVSGLTVLPGFIDCHVHVLLNSLDLMQNLNRPFSYQFFLAQRNLEKTLDAGITTVRDASGADLGIQEAVRDGLIDGPELYISIIALSQTGGHGDHWHTSGNWVETFMEYPGRPGGVVDGPDEMRKRVRELIRNGANVIKANTSGGVFSPRDDPSRAQFSDEELSVLVEEASRAGIPAMAHAHGVAGVKAAVRAGFRSIEHGTELDDEAIEMMIDKNVWLVPTLGVDEFILERVEAGAAIAPAIVEKAKANGARRADSFRRAAAAGVRIAMGSDAAAESHGTNLKELRLMAATGLDPLQALHAATGSAAELLGAEESIGRIAPGLRADLVVVEGDPLDFNAYPRNIRSVYRRGRLARGRKL